MWVAMDECGTWYGYNMLPSLNIRRGCWDKRTDDPVSLKHVERTWAQEHWTDTLESTKDKPIEKTEREKLLETLGSFSTRELKRALDIIALEAIL